MSSMNPEDDLTPVEMDNLDQLESVGAHGLGTYTGVAEPWAELRDRPLYRDSHPTFEAYARERWGVDVIRLAVRRHGQPDPAEPVQKWDPWEVPDAIVEELLPTLRWLLNQASGTIGRVAHQLEHRAAEIDD